jgi:hypothetical protein
MPRYREEGHGEQSNGRNIRDFAQVQEDHLSKRSGNKKMPIYIIGNSLIFTIALLLIFQLTLARTFVICRRLPWEEAGKFPY